MNHPQKIGLSFVIAGALISSLGFVTVPGMQMFWFIGAGVIAWGCIQVSFASPKTTTSRSILGLVIGLGLAACGFIPGLGAFASLAIVGLGVGVATASCGQYEGEVSYRKANGTKKKIYRNSNFYSKNPDTKN